MYYNLVKKLARWDVFQVYTFFDNKALDYTAISHIF